MNIRVKRQGRKILADFATEGTLMGPPLEEFGAAVGTLVHKMRKGDFVEVSFERVTHMPLVCSRDLDRVVRQANDLPCQLRLRGLPGEFAKIYSRFTAPPESGPRRMPRLQHARRRGAKG